MAMAGIGLCASPAFAGRDGSREDPGNSITPRSVARPERATTATIVLDETTFDRTIDKGGIVFIDWWSPWCAACRAFGPVYERVAARHPDVTFARIDTDQERALSSDLRIESIPTLMAIREGVIVATRIGTLSEAEVEALVQRVHALDMDTIRAEIAREKAAAAGRREAS
jgi:thioredoxin